MIARVYTRKRKGDDGKTIKMYGVRYPWGTQDVRLLVSRVKSEAEVIAADITRLSALGEFKGPSHARQLEAGNSIETFAQLCENFLATHEKRVRPASADKNRRIIRVARVHFGEKWNDEDEQFTGRSESLLALTPSRVQAFIEGLHVRGQSPVTRNRTLALLHQMFEYAVDTELIERTPIRGMKKLPENERKRKVEPGEHTAILAHAPGWLAPILDTAFDTGARLGDLLGDQYGKAPLQWEQLHLDDQEPHVLFSAESTKEKADRKVNLNTKLVGMFKAMRKARFGDLAARTGAATGPVFVRVISKKRPGQVEPVSSGSISKALQTAINAAKVEEVRNGERLTFHCYRRSFCTYIANAKTVTLKQAMSLAGHRTFATHLKYQQPDDAGKAEAVEFLGNLAPGRHRETTRNA